MAFNGLYSADVPLRNCSLTTSWCCQKGYWASILSLCWKLVSGTQSCWLFPTGS